MECERVKVEVPRRSHFLQVIFLPCEEAVVSVLAANPRSKRIVGEHLSIRSGRRKLQPVGNVKVSVFRCSVRTGVFKPNAPRLAFAFVARALDGSGELKRNESRAALPQEMSSTFASRLVCVA